MSDLTRRKFLKQTAGVAASSVLFAGSGKVLGANERVRIATIGVGKQGSRHANSWAGMSTTELVAVADVDPKHREENVTLHGCKGYEDFRRLLDDKSIDAVSIATPDHWHTPVAIAALVAGKHVYVEKPCSHTIWEGQVLVKAAKKFGKCVQHGTNYRGSGRALAGIQFMREGGIGDVYLAKAINHQRRKMIGKAPVTAPPTGVNYDLWLGPAPVHPFTKNRWHYQWHWFWDYGTGDVGNDGIHQIDVARWGLGVGLPTAASISGGQLWYNDDHQTPDTMMAVFDYEEGKQLVFEMRLWTRYKLEGHDNGNVFYGTKGKLEIGRDGCNVTMIGEERKPLEAVASQGTYGSFIQCIKDNTPEKLNSPIDEGFASAVLCHIGNIGVRLNDGRIGGARLEYDGKNHRFIGNNKANQFLVGHYRKGYELAWKG
jgi:predicted dehydrogenase